VIAARPVAAGVLEPPRLGRRQVRPQPTCNATIVAREPLTDAVHVLRLRPDGGPVTFRAGQYLSLGLRGSAGWVLRPYSPANDPGGEGDVEFLVRHVPGGALTPMLWTKPIGARVHLGPPKGIFRLIPGDRRTHLFLATGTGAAPIVSMAAELVATGSPPPLVVVHGVREPAELAFRGRIEGWIGGGSPIAYLPAVSGPGAEVHGAAAGRATDLLPGLWDRLSLRAAGVVAYLCGNPAVVSAAAGFLESRGVPPEAIRREEYWPASRPPTTAAMPTR
jgi:ferredoxin-NADP reductase